MTEDRWSLTDKERAIKADVELHLGRLIKGLEDKHQIEISVGDGQLFGVTRDWSKWWPIEIRRTDAPVESITIHNDEEARSVRLEMAENKAVRNMMKNSTSSSMSEHLAALRDRYEVLRRALGEYHGEPE